MLYTGWPKIKPLPNYQKNCINFKASNEIRFLGQIKLSVTHYYPFELNILRVTYLVTSVTVPDPKSSSMCHIRWRCPRSHWISLP